jgi:hypothetical protein
MGGYMPSYENRLKNKKAMSPLVSLFPSVLVSPDCF